MNDGKLWWNDGHAVWIQFGDSFTWLRKFVALLHAGPAQHLLVLLLLWCVLAFWSNGYYSSLLSCEVPFSLIPELISRWLPSNHLVEPRWHLISSSNVVLKNAYTPKDYRTFLYLRYPTNLTRQKECPSLVIRFACHHTPAWITDR